LGYLSLRYAVKVGRCFIKNHDWGMLQQDSRALPFASTKHYAVLAAPEKEG